MFPIIFTFSSSRPSQLSSSLRRQVWSAVKRLDTISPKWLIMFDPTLEWCNSEIFKVATNSFYPAQDRARYLLASVTMLLPTELRHLHFFYRVGYLFKITLERKVEWFLPLGYLQKLIYFHLYIFSNIRYIGVQIKIIANIRTGVHDREFVMAAQPTSTGTAPAAPPITMFCFERRFNHKV